MDLFVTYEVLPNSYLSLLKEELALLPIFSSPDKSVCSKLSYPTF